jgi:hypothetical protein
MRINLTLKISSDVEELCFTWHTLFAIIGGNSLKVEWYVDAPNNDVDEIPVDAQVRSVSPPITW